MSETTEAHVSFVHIPVSRHGWSRQSVHLDGILIGYLDRRAGTYRADWLIADHRWNSVGARTYQDREAAVAALVAAAEDAS